MPRPNDLEEVKFCDCCGHVQFLPEMVVGEWNLLKCSKCGLVFTSPRPSEIFLRTLYEKQYYEEANAYFSSQQQRPSPDEILLAIALKREIQRNGHSADRFLEVGCGSGRLLEAFLKAGWQAVGIDLSFKAIHAGRTRGLDLRNVGIDDPELGHFDLIGGFHILEHHPSPKAFFGHCSQRLRPNGYLLIEVPDYGCRRAQRMREYWPYLFPGLHLYQFTEQVISQYLHQAGFEVIQSRKVHGRGPLEIDGASMRAKAIEWVKLKMMLFRLRHLIYWIPGSKSLIRHWLWQNWGYGEFIRVLACQSLRAGKQLE